VRMDRGARPGAPQHQTAAAAHDASRIAKSVRGGTMQSMLCAKPVGEVCLPNPELDAWLESAKLLLAG